MAEYIDREKLINDGMAKGFCDWYDEIKYAQKASVVEREKVDKAKRRISAAIDECYKKVDQNKKKMLAFAAAFEAALDVLNEELEE